MLVGRAWAGGAWAAGRVGRRWWRSAVLLPGVAGEAAPVGRGWRGQMGGIAALGVRHAGDTP
mgnify:CR=1 FL=1